MKSMKRAFITILAAMLFCLFAFSSFADVCHSCNDPSKCLFCHTVSEMSRYAAVLVMLCFVACAIISTDVIAVKRQPMMHKSLSALCVKLSE